jgi:hypothetical protein
MIITRLPSTLTYRDQLVRRAPPHDELIRQIIPLWRQGLDTSDIAFLLSASHPAMVHPSGVANVLARWRDEQQARAAA